MAISASKPMTAPIGIFGGTFDPVHFGHLRLALELKQALGLAEVRLLPCRLPPHRKAPVATPEQRLSMLQRALAGQNDLTVDERELQRDGFSYMFDTLVSLRSEMAATPLCLIIGSDALMGLPDWYRWQELIDLCHIVVMPRPGWVLPAGGNLSDFVSSHQVVLAGDLAKSAAGALFFQEVTQLDISATKIRELIARNVSPRYLLPDAVLALITEQGIYSDPAL